MRYRRHTLFTVVLLIAACDPQPRWCRLASDSLTTIATAPTRWHTPPHPVALWEVRASIDGQALRAIRAVAVHPTTRVTAVADHGSTAIIFIRPDGSSRWWSRRGRRTGELGVPVALEWTSDSVLAILDPANSKIVQLDTAGRVAGDVPFIWPATADFPAVWLFLRGSEIVGQPYPELPSSSPWETDVHVLRGNGLGAKVDTIVTRRVRMVPGDGRSPVALPGTPLPLVAPVGDSLLAIAGDIPEFRILLVDRSRKRVRQICRVTRPVPLTPAESTLAEAAGGGERPNRAARIGRLFASADGRIWAQRDRVAGDQSLPDRWFGPRGATFDVFARDGAYVGEVRAPADARIAAAIGDTIIALRDEQPAGVSIVAYHLMMAR